MQKLQFEFSWDKTISNQDRKQIEECFSTLIVDGNGVFFTSLRQARNHNNDLLVTVLISNTTQDTFTFNQTTVQYRQNNIVIAERSFTLPSLTIGAYTSMPWTFIFPEGCISDRVSEELGELVFAF